jgi:hypothetical protein
MTTSISALPQSQAASLAQNLMLAGTLAYFFGPAAGLAGAAIYYGIDYLRERSLSNPPPAPSTPLPRRQIALLTPPISLPASCDLKPTPPKAHTPLSKRQMTALYSPTPLPRRKAKIPLHPLLPSSAFRKDSPPSIIEAPSPAKIQTPTLIDAAPRIAPSLALPATIDRPPPLPTAVQHTQLIPKTPPPITPALPRTVKSDADERFIQFLRPVLAMNPNFERFLCETVHLPPGSARIEGNLLTIDLPEAVSWHLNPEEEITRDEFLRMNLHTDYERAVSMGNDNEANPMPAYLPELKIKNLSCFRTIGPKIASMLKSMPLTFGPKIVLRLEGDTLTFVEGGPANIEKISFQPGFDAEIGLIEVYAKILCFTCKQPYFLSDISWVLSKFK